MLPHALHRQWRSVKPLCNCMPSDLAIPCGSSTFSAGSMFLADSKQCRNRLIGSPGQIPSLNLHPVQRQSGDWAARLSFVAPLSWRRRGLGTGRRGKEWMDHMAHSYRPFQFIHAFRQAERVSRSLRSSISWHDGRILVFLPHDACAMPHGRGFAGWASVYALPSPLGSTKRHRLLEPSNKPVGTGFAQVFSFFFFFKGGGGWFWSKKIDVDSRFTW